MPSPPRLSAITLPSAEISQPRKLLVPQSTTTKALAASRDGRSSGINPQLLDAILRQDDSHDRAERRRPATDDR